MWTLLTTSPIHAIVKIDQELYEDPGAEVTMVLVPAVFVFTLLLQTCFAPPVTQHKKENEKEPDSDITGLEDYMEYHRYLKEVVNALESDPDFRKKLENAKEDEIKSGKIAEELEFVSHHVRTKLDEIKRLELERLKQLMEQKQKLENGDVNSLDDDPTHHHLDHKNPHTFEIEDLKKLIAKTTHDLAEADKKRREEFKQYELEKEYQKEMKLNHTQGSEHERLEKEFKEREEKHKKHEPLHQPGHKAQLEEVWEKQDQMQQEFDPRTFFMLHDIDGNGLWDQDEVKALFIKELDKLYSEGAPEDDMRERAEEMERMRESVFREMDRNQDSFIDYNEFLMETKTSEFRQDNGWQALDEQRPYTDEELAEYIRMHEANQMRQGYPQGAGYQVPPGGHYPQQVPPGAYQQQVPPGGYQQQVPPGAYQQQVPMVAYQQVPGGYQQVQGMGNHPNVAPPQGHHPNAAPPQAQFHSGQMPPHQPQAMPHDYAGLNTNEVHLNQQQMHQQYDQQRQVHPPPQGSNTQGQVPMQAGQPLPPQPPQQNAAPNQNQVPVQPNQVPQQNELPVQQNQVPNQVPVQQQQIPDHQNQLPVQQNSVPNQQGHQ